MADISEFIRSFMREHKLTERKMAALTGLRNPSTLTQLLSGKCGSATAVEFEQAMLRSFVLTSSECDALRECVTSVAVGSEADAVKTREMWAYLRGEELLQGNFYLELTCSGQLMTLSERYARARQLRIMLLNTPYSTIYPELVRLMNEMDAKIEHYIVVGENDARTIRLTSDILRPIAHPNYECYVRVEEKNEQRCLGLSPADLMICAWEDERGQRWRDMVVFTAPDRGRLMARSGEPEVMNAIGIEKDRYMRIKRSYQGNGTLDDYVRMVKGYAEMERSSAIYALRPDLCLTSVAPDILRDAALAGGALSLNDDTESAIEELTQVFRQRYANLEQKRKRTWLFVKRDAMEQFARTGVMSGHFWGLRPFTPEERRRILADQLKLMRINANYRLMFLHNDCGVRDIDLRCCEDFGALIAEGHTDYNLDKGYTEILLGHRKFMKLFEDFAQEKLVAQC
jgi:transcriptional regulator with XRE-family HTH domain